MPNMEGQRSRGLTHAGDPLGQQVPEQRLHHRAVPAVKLVAVDPDVEAQPVGVRLGRQLARRAQLVVGALAGPGWRQEEEREV